jgi:hypothetical protein
MKRKFFLRVFLSSTGFKFGCILTIQKRDKNVKPFEGERINFLFN